ncbi:MAG: hypothetical protein LBJ64_09705, partial [Deltaproteobacteria bacterium]|nr:hypothetical protein [Deltaproteobacteria bacterium]
MENVRLFEDERLRRRPRRVISEMEFLGRLALEQKDVLKGLKLAFLASPYSSPLREFVVNREFFEGRFRRTFSSGDFEMTVQDMDIRDMDIHDMDI